MILVTYKIDAHPAGSAGWLNVSPLPYGGGHGPA